MSGAEVIIASAWTALALLTAAAIIFAGSWVLWLLWKLFVVINGRLRPLSAYYAYELHEEIKRRENEGVRRRAGVPYRDGGGA